MSTWLRDETPLYPADAIGEAAHDHTARVTPQGAGWLASASPYPQSTLALWRAKPTAPAVAPCGTAFDVVNVPGIFGRRMLDRLWSEGPGSGPVAFHRGRMLLFAAPGTAQRLPSLLDWEEWGASVPPLLCHGIGDAITIPPLTTPDPVGPDAGQPATGPRWVVAPDSRHPWLPGPEALLWARVRAARAVDAASVRISIFPSPDQDAKVYDVSRRR
ncbi:bifunctional DNA primase/polymerase [Streptomyces sp. NPDC000410]|uniref:bifunctional DNA primase/polymerase n=1 Tax=Streptomyces sp. NPDC000410 TaxID=3154254 RepID=UPI003326CB53